MRTDMEKAEFRSIEGVVKAWTSKAILIAHNDEEKMGAAVPCLGIREQMKHDARDYVQQETYSFRVMTWWLDREEW
jgi:hypothetical protein